MQARKNVSVIGRAMAVVAAFAMLGSGCGAPSSSSPAPTSPTSVTPGPSQTRIATLAISSYEFALAGVQGDNYWYIPAVTLQETGGKSTAYVRELRFESPHGGFIIEGYCLGYPYYSAVGPGQTWTLDDMDDPDCRNYLTSSMLGGVPVTVTVQYADRHGNTGTVTATVKAGSTVH